MFFDEAHSHGTTKISKNMVKFYNPIKEIYITATYNKPLNILNIQNIITWSLKEIHLC